jgi:quercetin dioxygenase-like cupin family protein
MDVVSLPGLTEDLLAQAREAHSGRAATTLHPVVGGKLRQTAIALTAGTTMADHESPGEATLHVLSGAVALVWSGDRLHLGAGQIAPIPPQRHGVEATEDAVVLLTVALAR